MDNQGDKTEVRKNFRVTEGILLAGFPAIIYLITYNFEKGYTEHFGLTNDLIQVTLSSVLNTFAIISTLAFLVLLALNAVWMIIPISHNRAWSALRDMTLFSLALIIFFLLAFGITNWREWTPLLFVVLVMWLIYVGFPLVKKGKTYAEKVEVSNKDDKKVSSFFDHIVSSFGINALLIPIAIISLPALSSIAGRASAVNRETFLVVDTIPEVVVIRNYEGKLITAPFDRQSMQVESIFLTLDINEHPGLLLKPENVGPLEVIEPTTTAIRIEPLWTATPPP